MSKKDEDEAFEHEMSAHPWGYGQRRDQTFEFAMAAIRHRGLWAEATVVMKEIERLKAERDALQVTLDDYMDDHKAVVNEQCAGDEIHCSCVPHLRKRIKEVEAERDALLAAAELMTAAIDAARSKT